jgi:hypothetical protein
MPGIISGKEQEWPADEEHSLRTGAIRRTQYGILEK